jgi:hypothetical protein
LNLPTLEWKHLLHLLNAVMLIVVLIWVLVTLHRTRQYKRRQDLLVASLKGQRYWRVNLARPAYFQRWLRLLPFEAKGVLIDEGDYLRVKGYWRHGGGFDSRFSRAQSQVQWLGNRSMKAGNLYWAQLTTPRGVMLFSADTGMYALPSREALSDIFRSAFPDFALDEENTEDFALEKNPASVSAMVVFFALFLFALLDTFAISRYELTDAQLAQIMISPLTWMGTLLGFAVVLPLGYQYLSRASVPARESMALTMFVAMALLGAALPLAKRADQWLADSPTQEYRYRVTTIAHLEPEDPSLRLPRLRFPRAREYWEQYPEGSLYKIPFLRGPMGLWQLDHEAFDPPLVAFYEKR